jgi:hypothetical protein
MNTQTKIKAGMIGLVGLVVISSVGTSIAAHFDRDTYIGIVTEKQIKRYNEQDKYLIFTKLSNGEVRVFENTDSLIEGKFNSSDVYGSIEKGKTYKFETYGWRLPFFSAYENIIGAKEIDPNMNQY